MDDPLLIVAIWLLLPFVPVLCWLIWAIRRQRFSTRSVVVLFASEAVVLGAFLIRSGLREHAVMSEQSSPPAIPAESR